MKGAHKLALGFGIVLLLMLGTLAADVFASTQQSAVADRLVHHLYPAREAAGISFNGKSAPSRVEDKRAELFPADSNTPSNTSGVAQMRKVTHVNA